MSRILSTIGTLAVVIIVAALVMRLADHHDVPNLIGLWKSWRSELNISRDGDLFTVTIDNPNGLLGGTYRGEFRDSAIHVRGPLAPLCGEIRYVTETQTLEFCGEEFERHSN
jgi:hypothetical protein